MEQGAGRSAGSMYSFGQAPRGPPLRGPAECGAQKGSVPKGPQVKISPGAPRRKGFMARSVPGIPGGGGVGLSRPRAFSRFLHLARRFWNHTCPDEKFTPKSILVERCTGGEIYISKGNTYAFLFGVAVLSQTRDNALSAWFPIVRKSTDSRDIKKKKFTSGAPAESHVCACLR